MLFKTERGVKGLLVFIILFVLIISPLSSASVSAEPDDPIPSNILDPDSVGWYSGRNYSSSAFGDWFSQLSGQGYMIIDIEVDEIDGEQRVGGVWQKNTDGRAWLETRNMSLSTFENYQDERRDAGYRMIDQEAYELGSNNYYAGIWIKNSENLNWVNYYDVTSTEFSNLFSYYSGLDYLIIDIDAYVLDGELLYSAIWVDNVEDLAWHEWRNLTSEEFSEKFAEYQDQYRMVDVESYRFGGQQYYAGIWVENKNNRGWAEWRGMSSKAFGEKWAELRDAGYRLIEYEVYPTASGWRYAGIWRQNTDRPDWALKDEVDTLLQDHFDEFDIPGMSVAIIQDGQFRYLRGFGDADLDDSVAADSRTIYRLASISKAVAGVLGLRLQEEELINLSMNSRDYVTELPDHHTHTVSQTLSNRSGIGHYEDYPSIVDAYFTAKDAAMELWDDPLVYTPGEGYKYSTHAYTFAGASMEEAVGLPISYILEIYLQSPYNLDTLELDRTLPDSKRSLLYNSNNDEVSADDLSWKVLGGGLESSAYDLARFGNMVINGTILTETSRDQMWTPPDSRSDYALGWNTGTESGTQVVAKSGAQNGARSYIRMYPDENIVIVILTNRKTGGHSPVQLGRDIGALMLAELNSSSVLPGIQNTTQEMIDEPDSEGLPAADVIWPESNPVANPTLEDLQEEQEEAPILDMIPMYLPLIIR